MWKRIDPRNSLYSVLLLLLEAGLAEMIAGRDVEMPHERCACRALSSVNSKTLRRAARKERTSEEGRGVIELSYVTCLQKAKGKLIESMSPLSCESPAGSLQYRGAYRAASALYCPSHS